MSFESKKIKDERNRRLRNIASSIEMELLDIIMKEYDDMGLKDIDTLGLALGIYSITMQFTSNIQLHTLQLMIKAQTENQKVDTSWRYKLK